MSDDVKQTVELINQLQRDAMDNLRQSNRDASVSADRMQNAFKDFTKVVKSTTTAFASGDSSFKKFNASIDMATDATKRAVGSFGLLGATAAGIVKIIGAVTKGVFDYSDNILKGYDALSQFGTAVGTSSDALNDIVNNAGFTSVTMDGFIKSFNEANTALLNLGGTSAQGLKRFSEILMVSPDVRDEMVRLGYSQQQFADMQAKYISLQASYGLNLAKTGRSSSFESVEYAKTINTLSGLTGEERDKVAARLAENARDVAFTLKIRRLKQEGNDLAAKRLEQAAYIASVSFGPTIGAGVRDFLANGFATTKQGEAVIMNSQGLAAKWSDQIESGVIDPLQFNQMIAKGQIALVRSNTEALQLSKSYQEDTGITSKSLENSTNLLKVKSMNEIDSFINDITKPKASKLKDTQADQLRTERMAAIAMDKLAKQVSGPVNSAFIKVANLVSRFAQGAVEFAASLGITGAKELRDSMMTVEQIDTRLGVVRGKSSELFQREKELTESKKITPEESNKIAKERVQYTDEMIRLRKLRKSKVSPEATAPAAKPPPSTETTGAAPTTTEDGFTQAVNAGLILQKSGKVAHGPLTQTTLDLAKRVQAELPGFLEFTSLNDKFHQQKYPNSRHALGQAFDFKLRTGKPTVEEGRAIVEMLKSWGAAYVQDEYNFPSPGSTGGHIHVQLKAMFGDIFDGPKSGYNIEAHGKEAVIPLMADNSIPVTLSGSMLTEKISTLVAKAVNQIVASKQDDKLDIEILNMLMTKVEELTNRIEYSTNIQSEVKMFMSS